MKKNSAPPDQDQRDLILKELDTNMLVEAAAGTGKTTSMVARMTALIRKGKCAPGTMAAVTFTRKAAAELRSRFQAELGDEFEHIEQCFVGTIHSFCARLLRERPVEAAVDVSFIEMDEEKDDRLRAEAWDEYTAGVMATDSGGILAALRALGLRLEDLRDTFNRFADYPDVDEWPAEKIGLPDLGPVVKSVTDYTSHMQKLFPKLPREWGNDRLIPEYRRLPRVISHYSDLNDPAQLMQVLGHFDKKAGIVQKEWMKDGAFSKEQAKKEQERWDEFHRSVVEKNLRVWRECRYELVIRVMKDVRDVYDRLRAERGLLNYQDLLIKAAALLRDKPHVRKYFQKRFTHILVDEFQDTDPIQAEVLLLLTASDLKETDWRTCNPSHGSLFVVGDPKQSIYRFRRADIVTYNQVKEIIRRGAGSKKGLIVSLSANFRTTGGVVDWINSVFRSKLPEKETEHSPAHVALQKGRLDESSGDLADVFKLTVPSEFSRKEDAVNYEADRIARTIRNTMDKMAPSDFMIVTHKRANLSVYAGKLQEYGIPHHVTGGSALNEVDELKLLHRCLAAVVHPDNSVLLVGALRSELFGISDAALYAFKRAGGEFSYKSVVPRDLFAGNDIKLFEDAFDRLKRYSSWLAQLPPASAIEKIIGDLGLAVLAGARPGGDVEAGSLAKAVELLRGVESEMWSVAQIVDYLGQIVEQEERYDGISARSGESPAVRVMNLHKVKGLEAPVVFLADPSGEFDHGVDMCVDRSGDTVRGYLAVYGEQTGWARPVLATPPGWESLAGGEKAFRDAEAVRMRYVAATRSGSAVIISQKEKRNDLNPWKYFHDDLKDCPELEDPGPQAAAPVRKKPVSAASVSRARNDIEKRLAASHRATYDASGAKEYALGSIVHAVIPTESPSVDGEHGVEWGEVIHSLLEIAMENSGADLCAKARAELAEHGLDTDLADEAVSTVKSVAGSEIWKRANASSRRFVEAPFQILKDGEKVPIVLRGAIDLVFEEDGGWVLVDYKTDRIAKGRLKELIDRYSHQMCLYARAWEKCSGQKVKESGLYFTRLGEYVRLKRG